MHERLEEAVNENGEIMIRMDSGEDHELHKHNVTFLDDHWARIDTATETHWLNTEKVERYWIHKDF